MTLRRSSSSIMRHELRVVVERDHFVDEGERAIEPLGLAIRYRQRAKAFVVRALENLQRRMRAQRRDRIRSVHSSLTTRSRLECPGRFASPSDRWLDRSPDCTKDARPRRRVSRARPARRLRRAAATRPPPAPRDAGDEGFDPHLAGTRARPVEQRQAVFVRIEDRFVVDDAPLEHARRRSRQRTKSRCARRDPTSTPKRRSARSAVYAALSGIFKPIATASHLRERLRRSCGRAARRRTARARRRRRAGRDG